MTKRGSCHWKWWSPSPNTEMRKKGVIGCSALLLCPPVPPLPLPRQGKQPLRRPHRILSCVGCSQEGNPPPGPPPPSGTQCLHSPCRGCHHPHQVTDTFQSKTWSSKENPDLRRTCCPGRPHSSCGSHSLPHQAHYVPPSEVGPAAPPLRAAQTESLQQVQLRCFGRDYHDESSNRGAAGAARRGCRGWSRACPESPPWGRALCCHPLRRYLLCSQNRAFACPGAGKAGCGSGPSSTADKMTVLKRTTQTVSMKSWKNNNNDIVKRR